LQVYLTKRRRELMFLGGFHVFPGGKVDPEDYDEKTINRCSGLSPEQAAASLDVNIPPELAIGFYVAGIRELFEEAGILLAENTAAGQLTEDNETWTKKISQYRSLIHDNRIRMIDMLEKEGLCYALDRLTWFSHWITPATSPRRFDTQFFIACLPPAQKASPFDGEIESAEWITPQEAIKKWRQGKLRVIPPTLASLDKLCAYESYKEIIK